MQKYYSLDKIKKYQCPYRVIIGKRSNGKTYSVIADGLKIWAKTGKKFAYVRRYREDITKPNLEHLLDPHDISKLTGGAWVGFDYRSRQFRVVDSEDKKGDIVCETFSLNAWERQKGADRGKFSIILFDEFITRDQYLKNEVDTFLDVISTIVRDRGTAQIYMVANTISQFCPYFGALGIDIKTLKQGQIAQINDRAVIEWCNDNGKQSSSIYFDGFRHSKMISGGEWDIRKYPSLYPKSHLDFTFVLRFFVILSDRKIAGEILTGQGAVFLYFYPFTGEIKHPDNTIIYGGKMDINALHAADFNSGSTGAHALISDLIRQQKMFFADNLTGEGITAFINGGGRE